MNLDDACHKSHFLHLVLGIIFHQKSQVHFQSSGPSLLLLGAAAVHA